MLTLESLKPDKFISVLLAIGFAEKALPIWEREYPKDMRPRRAIEAAKEWLKNPADAAADAAANAANAAANATNAAANAAARAAYAANAAYAAYDAYDAYDAAYTAAHAALALGVDEESLIHEVILENLDWIPQYKIDNGQNFAQPELVFDHLTKEQRQIFLFNLDVVVK